MFKGADFGFVGDSYVAPMTLQDAQDCINWYLESSPRDQSKMPNALLGCPGLSLLFNADNAQARGMYVLPGSQQALFSIGFKLFLITMTVPATSMAIPTFAATQVGTLLTDTGQVVMRDNGVLENGLGGFCLIVDGTFCYYYYLSGNAPTATFSGTLVGGSPTIQLPGAIPNGIFVTTASTLTDISGGLSGGTKITAIDTVNGTITLNHNAVTSVVNDQFTFTASAFGQITDAGFLGANRIAFIEGYLIFNKPYTRTFYCTGPGPYTILFPGLYFALKDSSTDNLVTLYEENRELWLIGERTSEVWYNAGGASFPFARIPGVGPQIGCSAPYSIARCGGQLVWLGANEQGINMVVSSANYSWNRCSTHAIEYAISTYPVISDAIGYGYEDQGHIFYVLTFPTADVTWCFDFTAQAWHKRLSYDVATGLYHRHLSNCFMNFGGINMVGDYANGNLYWLSRQFFTDNGAPLRALRRTGPIWSKENRERIFHSQLQLDFTEGQGQQGLPSGTPAIDAGALLLLHFDGASGQTTTVDSSQYNNPVFINSGVTSLTTTNPKFGTASFAVPQFDPIDNPTPCYVPFTSGGLLDIFRTGAWTIECFALVNYTSGAAAMYILTYNATIQQGTGSGLGLTLWGYTNNAGALQFTAQNNGAFSGISSMSQTIAGAAGTWHHFALVNNGTDTTMYIDGVNTVSPSTNWNVAQYNGADINPPYAPAIAFGTDSGYSGPSEGGQIDEVRVSNYAVYTANFTPPTAPFPNGQAAIPPVPENAINPSALLRWSDDGGYTWSNERRASIGQSGQFRNRTMWRQLGKARDRVYEVVVSDPVPRDIIGATLYGEST